MMEDDSMGMMLQFSDSTLPVGSYAHSFGLEGMCQAEMIKTVDDLRLFLVRDVSHSLMTVDLPLMLRGYQAALELDGELIRHWDEVAWAMRPTRQLREAAGRIGRQTWLLYQKTWRELEGGSFVHYQAPIVSGVIFAERGVSSKAASWTVVYQTFSALVQSALKLLPLGPSAVQLVLRDALVAIGDEFAVASAISDEELGSFNPLWDIAASRHERADARLFIS
ncbi:MAG: urease accessory UreF family protein [Akkermansiaceae bacterium]|jgi:urease accessory protein